jgi:hypothetical protein
MAKYNEILVGRLNRALQKFTGIKGAAPVSQLGSEIMPVLPLFWGAESRYLDSWQMFGSFSQIGASPGNLDVFHFRNPVGSNVIAVIQKLAVGAVGAGALLASVEGPNPSTAADDQGSTPNFTRFDARGNTSTNMKLTFGNPVADTWPGNSKSWAACNLGANSTYDFLIADIHEFPLLPGDGFRVVEFNVNATMNVSIQWRERFLEDSERF